MKSSGVAIVVVSVMVLIDVYVYWVIRSLMSDAAPRTKLVVTIIYWLISILAVAGLLLFAFTPQEFLGRRFRMYLFAMIVTIFISKLIASVFFLIDDIRRIFQWVVTKLFFRPDIAGETAVNISRSAFLSWIGVAFGGTLMSSLLHGLNNKYNYQLKKVQLKFDNLPEGLKGLKILLFSDVHAGSFDNKKAVNRGLEMIKAQNADLIIFGGDLVNDVATEIDPYMDIFSTLRAPMGVYSVFGNHDYGDYARWPIDGVTKEENLEILAKKEAELGWRLLRNEHVILERNGAQFPLIGVENWSNVGHFPKYGDLPKAYEGAEDYPFKILVSHDPSHWDAQIRSEFPDIDLTLSGHTHGFQFGVEIPGFRWSPVQYVYKEWKGLYEEGKQKIYVNPGYGFIGYPGRVGILPEITVIELM
ncbi:MAG: metallophosphoesterase [Chitinophagaceae bacterium]|nr:metallophosphoesterase [Chitinophagaceae bacterium]